MKNKKINFISELRPFRLLIDGLGNFFNPILFFKKAFLFSAWIIRSVVIGYLVQGGYFVEAADSVGNSITSAAPSTRVTPLNASPNVSSSTSLLDIPEDYLISFMQEALQFSRERPDEPEEVKISEDLIEGPDHKDYIRLLNIQYLLDNQPPTEKKAQKKIHWIINLSRQIDALNINKGSLRDLMTPTNNGLFWRRLAYLHHGFSMEELSETLKSLIFDKIVETDELRHLKKIVDEFFKLNLFMIRSECKQITDQWINRISTVLLGSYSIPWWWYCQDEIPLLKEKFLNFQYFLNQTERNEDAKEEYTRIHPYFREYVLPSAQIESLESSVKLLIERAHKNNREIFDREHFNNLQGQLKSLNQEIGKIQERIRECDKQKEIVFNWLEAYEAITYVNNEGEDNLRALYKVLITSLSEITIERSTFNDQLHSVRIQKDKLLKQKEKLESYSLINNTVEDLVKNFETFIYVELESRSTPFKSYEKAISNLSFKNIEFYVGLISEYEHLKIAHTYLKSLSSNNQNIESLFQCIAMVGEVLNNAFLPSTTLDSDVLQFKEMFRFFRNKVIEHQGILSKTKMKDFLKYAEINNIIKLIINDLGLVKEKINNHLNILAPILQGENNWEQDLQTLYDRYFQSLENKASRTNNKEAVEWKDFGFSVLSGLMRYFSHKDYTLDQILACKEEEVKKIKEAMEKRKKDNDDEKRKKWQEKIDAELNEWKEKKIDDLKKDKKLKWEQKKIDKWIKKEEEKWKKSKEQEWNNAIIHKEREEIQKNELHESSTFGGLKDQLKELDTLLNGDFSTEKLKTRLKNDLNFRLRLITSLKHIKESFSYLSENMDQEYLTQVAKVFDEGVLWHLYYDLRERRNLVTHDLWRSDINGLINTTLRVHNILKPAVMGGSLPAMNSIPLVAAIKKGEPKTIEEILKEERNPNIILNKEGDTLLHFVVKEHFDIDIIQLLMQFGALSDTKNSEGETPYSILLKRMPSDQTRQYSSIYSPDEEGNYIILETFKSSQGYQRGLEADKLHTVLRMASSKNTINDQLRKLIEEDGYEVSLYDEYGEVPLCLALGRRFEIKESCAFLENLLKRGARPDKQNYIGLQESALHLAAQKRSSEAMKILLNYSKEVSMGNTEGTTPLHYAVGFRNVEIAALLLNKGADVHARDYLKLTPILVCSINQEDMLKLLLDKRANPNDHAPYHGTLLEQAEEHLDMESFTIGGCKAVLKIRNFLLNNGAYPTIRTTPFIFNSSACNLKGMPSQKHANTLKELKKTYDLTETCERLQKYFEARNLLSKNSELEEEKNKLVCKNIEQQKKFIFIVGDKNTQSLIAEKMIKIITNSSLSQIEKNKLLQLIPGQEGVLADLETEALQSLLTTTIHRKEKEEKEDKFENEKNDLLFFKNGCEATHTILKEMLLKCLNSAAYNFNLNPQLSTEQIVIFLNSKTKEIKGSQLIALKNFMIARLNFYNTLYPRTPFVSEIYYPKISLYNFHFTLNPDTFSIISKKVKFLSWFNSIKNFIASDIYWASNLVSARMLEVISHVWHPYGPQVRINVWKKEGGDRTLVHLKSIGTLLSNNTIHFLEVEPQNNIPLHYILLDIA